MSISVKDIVVQLTTTVYTAEEIEEIRSAFNYAIGRAGRAIKATIAVGDQVKFTSSRTGREVHGKVVKVNRKNAKVQEGHMMWRVPLSMLTVL